MCDMRSIMIKRHTVYILYINTNPILKSACLPLNTCAKPRDELIEANIIDEEVLSAQVVLVLLDPCFSFLTRWCVFVEPDAAGRQSGARKLPEGFGDAGGGKSISYQWFTDWYLDCCEKQRSCNVNLLFKMK